MTSMPASRSARATTLAPRSWPSRPGLAMRTRMGGWIMVAVACAADRSVPHRQGTPPRPGGPRSELAQRRAHRVGAERRNVAFGAHPPREAAHLGGHVGGVVAEHGERPPAVAIRGGGGAGEGADGGATVRLLDAPRSREAQRGRRARERPA